MVRTIVSAVAALGTPAQLYRSIASSRAPLAQAAAESISPRKIAMGTQQPIIRASLRCRPERVSGTPSRRDKRLFAALKPVARFHETENPYFRRRPIDVPFMTFRRTIVA
jgi:hypothetical protein